MYIYLDESGDLGFEFGDKKPSSYFIITLLVCDNQESAKTIKKSVEKTLKNRMYNKTKHSHVHELKGTKTNLGVKRYFFQHVDKNNAWKIYSIILDKKIVLRKLPMPIDKHRIYNVMANHLY